MRDSEPPAGGESKHPGRGGYDRSLSPSVRAQLQRERLVRAAVDVILDGGLSRLTVEHVVKSAGLGRNTFYGHFENTEQILVAAVERSGRCFNAAIAQLVGTPSLAPTEALHDAARAWFNAVDAEVSSVTLLLLADRLPLKATLSRVLLPVLEQGMRAGLLARPRDEVHYACLLASGMELTQQCLLSPAARDWPATLAGLTLALLR